MMRARFSGFLCVYLGAAAATARANANDEAIALALFNEGKTLATGGDYAAACEKFESADRLTGWLGVELNLADCYVHVGRTASAWVLWRKAADKAEAAHDDRAAYARARAAELEPNLARLTVAAPPHVRVRIDEVELSGAELGLALPIDPGDHVVAAGPADQPAAWSQRVTIEAGTAALITVPPLGVPEGPPPPRPKRHPARSHRLEWTLGGVSAAMLGATAWLALTAKRDYDAAVEAHCDSQLKCDGDGLDEIDSARRRGNIATVVGLSGLAAGTAAVVLLVVRRGDARRSDDRAITLSPSISRTSIGLALGGRL